MGYWVSKREPPFPYKGVQGSPCRGHGGVPYLSPLPLKGCRVPPAGGMGVSPFTLLPPQFVDFLKAVSIRNRPAPYSAIWAAGLVSGPRLVCWDVCCDVLGCCLV